MGANRRRKIAEKHNAVRRKAGRAGRTAGVAALCCVAALSLVSALGFAGVKTAQRARLFQPRAVREVRVAGVRRLDSRQVAAAAGLALNVPVSAADMRAAAEKLAKEPWIETVKISRRLSGAVRISVSERKPVALVNLGSVRLMDRHGFLMTPESAADLALPLFSGLRDTLEDGMRRISRADLARVARFRAALHGAGGEWTKRLSQADFSQPGTVRVIMGPGRAVVRFNESDVGSRLAHLSLLLETVKKEYEPEPRTIDLCYGSVAYVQR